MSDFISRQAVCEFALNTIDGTVTANDIMRFPFAEPDNQVHLCCYCKYYQKCSAEMSDIIFGNGIGHINVCACAKFAIKPERTAKVISDDVIITVNGYRYHYDEYLCNACKKKVFSCDSYCSHCGAKLDWSWNE